MSDQIHYDRPRASRSIRLSKKFGLLLVGLAVLSAAFTFRSGSGGEGKISFWGSIRHLIANEDRALSGEAGDRINVLLLGVGGPGHAGPYLSDTIILASLKPSTKQLALLSIPRDLLVPIPGYGWRKINHASAFGEANRPGTGGQLAADVVSRVFNTPVHYYVRIDFQAFVDLIDALNGITVEVAHTLDDKKFPIPGQETATTSERYEHLHVESGKRKMDGELALKYARSRQASGVEGSDFARARRQQQIILALKKELFSISTLVNPLKIRAISNLVEDNIATNVQEWEVARFYQLLKELDGLTVSHRVLDDSPGGPLVAAIVDQAFILQPKIGDFSELQAIAQNLFNPESTAGSIITVDSTLNINTDTTDDLPSKIITDQPNISQIEVLNGTTIIGLASQTSQLLEKFGYEVRRIGNAPTQDYNKTVIYSLKSDNNFDTLHHLEDILEAPVAPAVPKWAQHDSNESLISEATDILVILGKK